MIKVAVLDDYQNIFEEFIDIDKHKDKFEFTIFNEPFQSEDEAILALEKFDALFVMRERTPLTKALLEGLKNLKYIFTSGMRNKSIDLEYTKSRKIIVCGTEINSNPTAEITWALILGLMRNMKQEIDNMFQGYWQTTVGFELKGKILGIIGLGKIGSQVARIGKAFGMQVVAWSENLNLSEADKLGVLPMSKEELFRQSDIISLHVVLGERYKNLITSLSEVFLQYCQKFCMLYLSFESQIAPSAVLPIFFPLDVVISGDVKPKTWSVLFILLIKSIPETIFPH